MKRQSRVEKLSGMALNGLLVMVCLGTLVKGGYGYWISTWRDVYEPAQGVVCDTQSAFCADAHGVSLSLTEQYLGRSAKEALQARRLSKAGARPIFTLSSGVLCDGTERQCYRDANRSVVSLAMTDALYAPKGASKTEH